MEKAIGELAAGVGHLVRLLWVLVGWVPVAAGPALVLYGTWLIYHPACYILAGLAICTLTLAQSNPRRGRGR
jgi:hypothetical protein